MILLEKTLNTPPKRLLETIKIARYKINIQKSLGSYTLTMKYQEKKWKKQNKTPILFATATKKGELGTKEVKDLVTENYKTLLKAMEEDTKKWTCISCSRIGRINIVNMEQKERMSQTGQVNGNRCPKQVGIAPR